MERLELAIIIVPILANPSMTVRSCKAPSWLPKSPPTDGVPLLAGVSVAGMRAGRQAQKTSFFRRDPAAIPRISCRPSPPRPHPAASSSLHFYLRVLSSPWRVETLFRWARSSRERSRIWERLGVVIRDLSLDAPFRFPGQPRRHNCYRNLLLSQRLGVVSSRKSRARRSCQNRLVSFGKSACLLWIRTYARTIFKSSGSKSHLI